MDKNWADYQDSYGLVTQKQSLGGDAGDSCNRTFVSLFLSNSGALGLRKLNDRNGKWRRSWDTTKWYSNYDRTSRDQLIPVVIYYGMEEHTQLWSIFKDHLKRGLLFAYNTRRNFVYPTLEEHIKNSTSDVPWDYYWKLPDVTGPEFWALYIRGFRCRLLYPILYAFDVFTLMGAIQLALSPKEDDVINHAITLEYAKRRMDTFVMKLARKITPRKLLQERLDTFFGREIEPPINELYRQYCQKDNT